MATPDPHSAADNSHVSGFASAVSADLELIASLHDREWPAAVIMAARACPISEQLSLVPATPSGIEAMGAFDAALSDLPAEIDQAVVDEMASDYADIYLRHFHRAAPMESVWLTEDGLVRQEPMFKVQTWYRRANLRVVDWAQRPDDHLVLELRFLAHLFASAAAAEGTASVAPLADAAQFLDAHPLRWVGQLADRLSTVGASPVYAALARLTSSYLENVRDVLVDVAASPRPVVQPVDSSATVRPAKEKTCADPDDRPYVPGMAPSW